MLLKRTLSAAVLAVCGLTAVAQPLKILLQLIYLIWL